MARILLSLSVLFLTLSAVFGVLNTSKTREAREAALQAEKRAQTEKEALLAREKTRPAPPASVPASNEPDEKRLGLAEAELVRIQSERTALQAKLKAQEAELAELRGRLEAGSASAADPAVDALPMPGAGDLQTELEETRRQLDHAERDKQRLTQKIRATEPKTDAPQPPVRRAIARPPRPEVRGTVLAVNQAYNFVVLNIGGRQGLEANADMLVLRRGTVIGKLRVSSVEPATAIGDIVSHSLARGVQVQPGDVVIYVGSNP